MKKADLIAAFHDPDRYAIWHSDPGLELATHPFEPGLIATSHALLSELAQHPDMQAVDRTRARQGRALAALFDHHPHFQNEPEHRASRKQAFALLGACGMGRAEALAHEVLDRRLDKLWQRSGGDLVQDVILPAASEFWSHIVFGHPGAAEALRQAVTPISDLMAFERTADTLDRADAAAVELEALHQDCPCTEPVLSAAMAFDGIDGTSGMTVNALLTVLMDPAMMTMLLEGTSSAQQIWTEAVRLQPAIQGLFRSARADIRIAGLDIPAGTNVLMLNAAGNRDPRAFSDPNAIQPGRGGAQVLSFGRGPRACVGRGLAKLFGQAALRAVAARSGRLELRAPPVWSAPGLVRSPTQIMVGVA